MSIHRKGSRERLTRSKAEDNRGDNRGDNRPSNVMSSVLSIILNITATIIVAVAIWIWSETDQPGGGITKWLMVAISVAVIASSILTWFIVHRKEKERMREATRADRREEEKGSLTRTNKSLESDKRELNEQLSRVQSDASRVSLELRNVSKELQKASTDLIAAKERVASLEGEVRRRSLEVEAILRKLQTTEEALGRMQKLEKASQNLHQGILSIQDSGIEMRESVTKNVLRKYLADITAIFGGDVCRAIVYLPDPKEEYLESWVHHESPAVRPTPRRFHIGADSTGRKRGAAAMTYLNGMPRRVKITQTNGKWHADDDAYINPKPPTHEMNYAVIDNRPIQDVGENVLGVLCLDSKNPILFENDEHIERFLDDVATRVAEVIVLSRSLTQMEQQITRKG
jgi:hypothetical protein